MTFVDFLSVFIWQSVVVLFNFKIMSESEKEYKSMKVPQLKEELRKRGLSVTGKKADLIQRLLESGSSPSSITTSLPKEKKEKGESDTPKKRKQPEPSEVSEESEEHDIRKAIKLNPLKDLIQDLGWKEALKSEFDKSYFDSIEKYVEEERKNRTVFPSHDETFSAFNLTPFDQVKVVILGQDPYFNEGQAHGLSFSVKRGVAIPPSLNRIYKRLIEDIPGWSRPNHGCLEKWAKSGVLLLNATLTVRSGEANSHAKCGWQTFTDQVIKCLSDKKENIIFFLWGTFAHKKEKLIDEKKHHVLKCAHPSPMSGSAWDECNHFSKANDILKGLNKPTISWDLD
eukprot:TRINITY_DN719_c0_g1_i2.p1 TRINITY_DN719_c0_g1~~TRINITY_DN719_c0_g1_i2.p1  ORF type:complete len:341 (+),score=61.33 TRINITY_DN719_c0_g1_i2:385-1407(+)